MGINLAYTDYMRKAKDRAGRLLSIGEASAEYGIAPGLLRRLIADRKLASIEFPGIKRILIQRDDIDALIEASKRNMKA